MITVSHWQLSPGDDSQFPEMGNMGSCGDDIAVLVSLHMSMGSRANPLLLDSLADKVKKKKANDSNSDGPVPLSLSMLHKYTNLTSSNPSIQK